MYKAKYSPQEAVQMIIYLAKRLAKDDIDPKDECMVRRNAEGEVYGVTIGVDVLKDLIPEGKACLNCLHYGTGKCYLVPGDNKPATPYDVCNDYKEPKGE